MLVFQKQPPGQDLSHLLLDTHKFGMPCKFVVRYSIPLQSHLQHWHIPDSPGYVTWMGGVFCQGCSLLCSASRNLTSSAQHFSHFTLPAWRGGLSQADPCGTDMCHGHRHGPSASWTWASSPQTLGENQSMAGRAGGAVHPRQQEGGHFSKGRGLLLIFCQRPHAHMLFPSWGSETHQKVQPGSKEIWDPLRVPGQALGICCSATSHFRLYTVSSLYCSV